MWHIHTVLGDTNNCGSWMTKIYLYPAHTTGSFHGTIHIHRTLSQKVSGKGVVASIAAATTTLTKVHLYSTVQAAGGGRGGHIWSCAVIVIYAHLRERKRGGRKRGQKRGRKRGGRKRGGRKRGGRKRRKKERKEERRKEERRKEERRKKKRRKDERRKEGIKGKEKGRKEKA